MLPALSRAPCPASPLAGAPSAPAVLGDILSPLAPSALAHTHSSAPAAMTGVGLRLCPPLRAGPWAARRPHRSQQRPSPNPAALPRLLLPLHAPPAAPCCLPTTPDKIIPLPFGPFPCRCLQKCFSFKHLLLQSEVPWPLSTPGPAALPAAPMLPILSLDGWTRNLPQQQDHDFHPERSLRSSRKNKNDPLHCTNTPQTLAVCGMPLRCWYSAGHGKR